MNAKKEPTSKSTGHDSREALLSAAKKVFALKGFEGATVKDLADEAGVNISLVSYHFGGKENLYRTCMESFGFERLEAAERILKAPTSKEDLNIRLTLFAEDIIDIHRRDPNTCKIIHRGMDSMDPITTDVFKNVFVRIFEALYDFIVAAQRSGMLKAEIDAEITTGLMFGSLMQMIRMDHLREITGKPTMADPEFVWNTVKHWVENHTQGIFV